MFVVMHLDVDQTPFAYGPFDTLELATADMANRINEFLADICECGQPMPFDAYTDEPATDVTTADLDEAWSDLTNLPDVTYRHPAVGCPNTDLFDRFFVVSLTR